MTPLGIRNNNPGNLRPGRIPWVGQYAVDGHGFCIFDTPEHGIRALMKDLLAYEDKDNLDTIAEFITRWDDDPQGIVQAYIGAVCKDCGWNPDQPYELHNPDNLVKITKAIIQHENGQQPYSDDLIQAALQDVMNG
jgi:hypothetical protein